MAKLAIEAAQLLCRQALAALGFDPKEQEIIASHLMDCEFRDLGFSGLARILSISDRLAVDKPSSRPISVLRETPVSARLDGGDRIGYLVAQRATRLAVEKARLAGIGMIGVSNTWYTGMLSYYAEQAVAEDLVVMIASNASHWVAPQDGAEARFGTNPICFGFPSTAEPVIWDIGTSAIIHAQVIQALRLCESLPPQTALDAQGAMTTDPQAALAGALMPWGGHKGSGLGLVVQMLGMLAGSPMRPGHLKDFGFFIIAIRPDLLADTEDFKADIANYAQSIRATPSLEGRPPVRMPFDRSRACRAQKLALGHIEVPDAIVSTLQDLIQDHTS
jgi:delta1-piperideine-2-carboxylate reductase